MNIFVLDDDPQIAASMHCDRHVVKMIVEYAQLLSTAHRLLDGFRPVSQKGGILHLLEGEIAVPDPETGKVGIAEPLCYRSTHVRHPCALWARETEGNYRWLAALFAATLEEYAHRYGKTHSTARFRDFLLRPPRNIPSGARTPFPQAMPEEYRAPGDAVTAYRNYYKGGKAHFATWRRRDIPRWFLEQSPIQ